MQGASDQDVDVFREIDQCDGEVIARLPLAPAVSSYGVTQLPAVTITPRTGKHDLTLYDWMRFADFADKLWPTAKTD